LREAWSNFSSPIEVVGLVHDGHSGNFVCDTSRPPGRRLTAVDFGSDYIGPLGHIFAIVAREARPPEGWTNDQFCGFVDNLFAKYQKLSGINLSDEGKLQVLRAMAIPPYKFVSSDSSAFFDALNRQVESSPGATLADRVKSPQGSAILEAMLRDKSAQEKYLKEFEQLRCTFQMLHDRTHDPVERVATSRLLQTIGVVTRTGVRVADAGAICSFLVTPA